MDRIRYDLMFADAAAHYDHAVKKHPYFADRFYTQLDSEPRPRVFLIAARKALEEAIRRGCVDAFMVLNCETCEIAEAYERGDMEQAREECFDAIAVLMRMIDVIDGMQPFGNPDAQQDFRRKDAAD